MRALALLLILANVCFWFWSQYIDVPESRPLTSNTPSASHTPQLLLAKERSASSAAANSSSATSSDTLTCVSVGPFNEDELAEQITQQLMTAGFGVTRRSAQSEVFAGYWVSLSGFATRSAAEQVLNQLHAAGVADAYILPDTDSPNVLSLGLFSEQRRAEQRRADIAKLGYNPDISNRTRQTMVTWLDVSLQEPGQWPDPTLLQPPSGGIVRLETGSCSQGTVNPKDSTQNSQSGMNSTH